MSVIYILWLREVKKYVEDIRKKAFIDYARSR